MTHLRRNIWGTGLARWRRKSPVALALAVLLIVAQVQTSLAAITNQAIANGTYLANPVVSTPSAVSVPVAAGSAAMTLNKSGVLNDDDGTPGLSAGDSIDWTITIENSGMLSLTGISISDPLATMTYQGGDTDNDTILDVDETWTYTGSSTVAQTDLDTNGGGDGDIDNSFTVNSDQLPVQNGSGAVAITPSAQMEIDKSVSATAQPFPGIHDVSYTLAVTNTGNVTLTNIRVTDDLAGVFSPATIVSGPSLGLVGFSGTGSANGSYDGAGDPQMLSGDVQLAPGQTGNIVVSLRVDAGVGSFTALNTAQGSSSQIAGPVPSDDPAVTPGDSNDQNPTPFTNNDGDGDGSPDAIESTVGDRDGDGISDASDYDPTGVFYCEADGRLLSGGLITVENLTGGGSQTGIGTSNSITIVRDGSDGNYQFHVSAPGDYRLSYSLPPGGVASTTRLPGAPLDITSLLPADPAVLGSGEIGSTGYLADFTAGANPFHLEFSIEAGDPTLFANNIPLQFCGSPQLTAAKSIASGPTLQGDGRSLITYSITATSSGDERVDEVQIADDLANVFGAGNYQLQSVAITASPVGFGAAINPFFDGDGNNALLTSGGDLLPGESVSVEVSLLVDVASGTYTNSVTASGISPLDSSPIPTATANVGALVVQPAGSGDIFVSKVAGKTSARLGETIGYTITINNNLTTAYTGVDYVDQMPAGFTYVAGSAVVAGIPLEPVRNGNELVWPLQTLPAAGTVTITFNLLVGAAAQGSEFVNYALVRQGGAQTLLSNIAKATVRRETEPVFDCSEVIGKVFDDKNRDGYLQDEETGIPGVRIATVRGLLITSDAEGRFHVTCAMIPDEDIGSNFEMKLDERTLPDGYRITTENPRVIRLTRGKLSKLNFGAAQARIVRLDLTEASFEPGSVSLRPAALNSIAGLLNVLDQEVSVLQIFLTGDQSTLSGDRLRATRQLIDGAWKARRRSYDLTIETAGVR
ncbi:MAG: hypothetical protein WBO55_16130 [Rhizobiaceae bacterium]